MKLVSRFTIWISVPVLVFLLTTAMMLFSIYVAISDAALSIAGILFFLALAFIWSWMMFGEFRRKLVLVRIGQDVIEAQNFLGFGRKVAYKFAEFDGFKTSLLPSNYDRYEYLYLMKGGSKIIILSQFYHNNYLLLKDAISSHVKNEGYQKFSYQDEVRDIFRK